MRTVGPSGMASQPHPARAIAFRSARKTSPLVRVWPTRTGLMAMTSPLTSSNRPRGWAMAHGINSSTVIGFFRSGAFMRKTWHTCQGLREIARPLMIEAAPPPIAPGRKRVALGAKVGDRIEARGAPGVATREPRKCEPEASPRSVLVDGFESVLGARRQVPALEPRERLQRPAIDVDRRLEQRAREFHS